MLKKIKTKIKEISPVSNYSTKIGMTNSNLYNFLNDKLDIRVSTLNKIIKPLDMAVLENLPDKFEEVESVSIDDKKYKKGNNFQGKKILFCFSSGDTSHQGVLLKDTDAKIELKVF